MNAVNKEYYDNDESNSSSEDEDGYESNVVRYGPKRKPLEDFDYDPETGFDFMSEFLAKIRLSDGTEEYIFSCGLRGLKRSFFPINCHLCKTSDIKRKTVGNRSLKAHVESREHQSLLHGPSPNAKEYRMPLKQSHEVVKNPIKIYPGEMIKTITPEYYDRVVPIVEFEFQPRPSDRIIRELQHEPIHDYNQTAPVIGLSYAVKMKDTALNKVLYHCLLCQTDIDIEPYKHFTSSFHIKEYITRHFLNMVEKITEEISSSIRNLQKREEIIFDICRVLYRRIELVKGLRKISIVDYNDFKLNFDKYRKNIRKKFSKKLHYNDQSIGYPNGEIEELIAKAIRGEQIIELDPPSLLKKNRDNKKYDYDNRKRRSNELDDRKHSVELDPPSLFKKSHDDKRYDYDNRKRRSNEIDVRKCSVEFGERKPSTEFDERKHSVESRDRKNLYDKDYEVWERYKKMFKLSVKELDKIYDDYEEYPEKHPLYKVEWRRFWQSRCHELKKEGINPANYDFKPEWEIHWSKLFKEYYKKDVERRQYDARVALKLPIEIETPPSSPSRERDHIKLEQEKFDSYSKSDNNKHRMQHTYEQQNDYSHHKRHKNNDNFDNEIIQKIDKNINEIHKQHDDNQITIISVLRKLAPLEDQLGSLGPKSTEYLGRAVIFEKTSKNNNWEEMFNDEELYIFFVTAKEKLYAQKTTGVLPFDKLFVAEDAMKSLENLIQIYDDYNKRKTLNRMNYDRNNVRQQEEHFHKNSNYDDTIFISSQKNIIDHDQRNLLKSGYHHQNNERESETQFYINMPTSHGEIRSHPRNTFERENPFRRENSYQHDNQQISEWNGDQTQKQPTIHENTRDLRENLGQRSKRNHIPSLMSDEELIQNREHYRDEYHFERRNEMSQERKADHPVLFGRDHSKQSYENRTDQQKHDYWKVGKTSAQNYHEEERYRNLSEYEHQQQFNYERNINQDYKGYRSGGEIFNRDYNASDRRERNFGKSFTRGGRGRGRGSFHRGRH